MNENCGHNYYSEEYTNEKANYELANKALSLQKNILDLIEENIQLRLILGAIMNDIPLQRDWFDPDLEKTAYDILRYKS